MAKRKRRRPYQTVRRVHDTLAIVRTTGDDLIRISPEDMELARSTNWHVNGRATERNRLPYVCGYRDGNTLRLSRLIAGDAALDKANTVVAHRNRNPLDLRRENLVVLTRSENTRWTRRLASIDDILREREVKRRTAEVRRRHNPRLESPEPDEPAEPTEPVEYPKPEPYRTTARYGVEFAAGGTTWAFDTVADDYTEVVRDTLRVASWLGFDPGLARITRAKIIDDVREWRRRLDLSIYISPWMLHAEKMTAACGSNGDRCGR